MLSVSIWFAGGVVLGAVTATTDMRIRKNPFGPLWLADARQIAALAMVTWLCRKYALTHCLTTDNGLCYASNTADKS